MDWLCYFSHIPTIYTSVKMGKIADRNGITTKPIPAACQLCTTKNHTNPLKCNNGRVFIYNFFFLGSISSITLGLPTVPKGCKRGYYHRAALKSQTRDSDLWPLRGPYASQIKKKLRTQGIESTGENLCKELIIRNLLLTCSCYYIYL